MQKILKMFEKILEFFGFKKSNESNCEFDTIPNLITKPMVRDILSNSNLIPCEDLLHCLKLYKVDNLQLFDSQLINGEYKFRPLNNFLIPFKNFKHGFDNNGNVFFEFYFELFTKIGNYNFVINCHNNSNLISDSKFDIKIENGVKYRTLKFSKKC